MEKTVKNILYNHFSGTQKGYCRENKLYTSIDSYMRILPIRLTV
jgi:hypothetical protein